MDVPAGRRQLHATGDGWQQAEGHVDVLAGGTVTWSRTMAPALALRGRVVDFEQADLASAETWLKKIPHAVGQNYTLGGRGGTRAFECSAGDKVRYVPDPDGDFTYHTNHPLVSRDWHPDYLARCEERERRPEEGLRECWRFRALQKRVRTGKPITIESIVDALASRDDARGPICGDWTYGCTVFVLGETAELHLAPGRPDRYALQRFGF